MRVLFLLVLLGAIPLSAEDWVIAGKTYHNVVVKNVYPDRVEITYDGGLGTPALKDLSPELQVRFGYEPARAKAVTDARAAAAAEAEKRVLAEAAGRDKRMAMDKQEASYSINKAPLQLCAKVQRNTDEGCWVVCSDDSTSGIDLNGVKSGSDDNAMVTALLSQLTASLSQTNGSADTATNAPAPASGDSSGAGTHYSKESLFAGTGVAPTASPAKITAGTYYLTGAAYTMNQVVNLIVYETKPVRGADGNLYRHFTTDKSEVEP